MVDSIALKKKKSGWSVISVTGAHCTNTEESYPKQSIT